MENVGTATETFPGPALFDPYVFTTEEPRPSDLSLSGVNGGESATVHNAKALPSVQHLASFAKVQYNCFNPQNASIYSSPSPGMQAQDLSSSQGNLKQVTAKKKKGMAVAGTGEVKAKKPKKTKKVKDMFQLSSGQQDGMAEGLSQPNNISHDLPLPTSACQPNSGDSRQNIQGLKLSAPVLHSSLSISSESSTSPHPYSYTGSSVITSSSMTPTSPSNYLSPNFRAVPDGRRQSVDSQDRSPSRPGSRASTVSTSSNSERNESKSREPTDSIPMSKILEIIEREKALGSSSPCKRRRTAKPQHIQDAEEEAKKHSAKNITDASSATVSTETVADGSSAIVSTREVTGASSSRASCKPSVRTSVNNTCAVPLVDGSLVQNLSTDGYPADTSAETTDKGFCFSGCEKDSSASFKNCEHKPWTAVVSAIPATKSTGIKLKEAAEQTYKHVSHPQPVTSVTLAGQVQSSVHNSVASIVNMESPLFTSSPHHKKLMKMAAEKALASQTEFAAETVDLSIPSSSSSVSNLHNGSISQKHTGDKSEVPHGFAEAFRYFSKTETSVSLPNSFQRAQTVCTTATSVVSSVTSASSVSSFMKTEAVFSEEQEKHSTQFDNNPLSRAQNHLSGRQGSIPTMFHSSDVQADTLSDAFMLPATTASSNSIMSPKTVYNGQLSMSSVELKTPSPLPVHKKDRSWSPAAVYNNVSGMESHLPQTKQPSSPLSRPSSTSGLSQSPVGSTPSPSRVNGSAPSPVHTYGSSPSPVHLHEWSATMAPGSCGEPSLGQNTLPNSGPLPPFGAFAGLSDPHNMTYSYPPGQYSGTEKHSGLNLLHVKKEVSGSTGKKIKRKPKSAVQKQNILGDSKHPVNNSGKLSSGLKVRNLKPLNGNWRNMQQVVDDKSNMKPVIDDYTSIKPSFVHDGFHVKPALGKGDLGIKAVTPPSYKQPPSPSCTIPNFANMSQEEELADRLASNRVEEVPQCSCLGPNYVFNESIEGPYYTQLGVAKDIPSVRQIMEQRTGLVGKAIRIEKIHYTGKEGRSTQGCPIAKWVIRRSGPEEKYLCVARKRPGHSCNGAYIIVVILAWEGVASQVADSLYSYLVPTLTKHGLETDRRCGTNDQKSCACQGADLLRRGASFSFGCSWSMYFNGCKFARSHIARKFKLKDTQKEEEIEEHLQNLATVVAPLYKMAAPEAYRNQVRFEENAAMCRLGKEKGRPFSGVTACVDFCAHSHKDLHNMQNGSTVVVTLTKQRGLSKPDDEQLHVLPLYVLDSTDEDGSTDGQTAKVQGGALEILNDYPIQARMRAAPLTPKRRGRQAKKESPAKRGTTASQADVSPGKISSPRTPSPQTPSSKEPSLSFPSQDSIQSSPDTPSGNSPAMQSPESPYIDKENSSASEDFLSQTFGPTEMYEKLWDYFYSKGSFPPPAFMEKWAAVQKQAMLNPSPPDSHNGANSLSGSSSADAHPSSPHHKEAEHSFSLSPQSVASPVGNQPHTLPLASSSPRPPGFSPTSPFLPPSPGSHHISNPLSPFASPAHSTCHSQPGSPFGSVRPSCDGSNPPECNVSSIASPAPSNPVMPASGSFVTPTLGQGPDEPTFTMMDPTVVKCEWQDNKESFHDPGIGGVAIALSHGAVLFEVAKRELHATTALKNPNRYQPTRISLVFYQHKNLNYYHHGYYEYERKLATQRQKRVEKLMEEGATADEAEKAVKPGRKRKKKEGEEEEKIDFAKTSAAQYKYMWEANIKHSSTLTTDSIITRWIDPQPMVTGPYQRWV